MSTGGAKLVVVKASSGPSGLYDSRTKLFMRFWMVANSLSGFQRVNTVIALEQLVGVEPHRFATHKR